mgnify:CR=1 FL=1
MGKKRNELKLDEFISLLKGGAIWIIMNVENNYEAADGVWFHLKQLRNDNCQTKPSVDKAWLSLKYVYLKEGIDGLINIVESNYDFVYLYKSKIGSFHNQRISFAD